MRRAFSEAVYRDNADADLRRSDGGDSSRPVGEVTYDPEVIAEPGLESRGRRWGSLAAGALQIRKGRRAGESGSGGGEGRWRCGLDVLASV